MGKCNLLYEIKKAKPLYVFSFFLCFSPMSKDFTWNDIRYVETILTFGKSHGIFNKMKQ